MLAGHIGNTRGMIEDISCWKIERVIRKHKLYPDKIKAEKTAEKIAKAKRKPKKRITQLVKENKLWFLLQVDTIVIYWVNLKRYFSRVRTPKDNPEVERFNGTLKYEWLYDCNLTTNCDEFNRNVTD